MLMQRVSLTINGAPVTAEIEPRTHLADFLREVCLLTGTHIGCEHGVCGACTVLLDGAPARSCIAFVAACVGADVRTIEGLQDDPIVRQLRAAFTAEHALQCGYCTPGMLVTARDIVLRVPNADDAQIRLELAGNLCRCTGYAGIVRAISRVLREDVARRDAPMPPLPRLMSLPAMPASETGSSPSRAAILPPAGPTLTLTINLDRPRAEIWSALHDPALLATCVPGARLVRVADGQIEGDMRIALGPMTAVFAGVGRLALDPATHTATLSGEGRDLLSGTHLSGTAIIALEQENGARTGVGVSVSYALRGPLAPLARGPVVQALAAGIADTVARNLERRLAGDAPVAVLARLSAGGMLLRIVWQRLRRWLRSIAA
jgi:carbon-monoxide dehydrogenase small subunit